MKCNAVNTHIIKKNSPQSIETTSRALKAGECVINPTDTIYGFSVIAPFDDSARESEKKINRIKGRGADSIAHTASRKPLIRLIARPEDVFLYAGTVPDFLVKKWPCALTVIARLKDEFAHNARETCAFRCPADSWLRDVIAQTGFPVFSTSVNRTGSPALTKIADIIKEFSREVSLIVDAGDIDDTLPSTIVDVSCGAIKVVRQGAVNII